MPDSVRYLFSGMEEPPEDNTQIAEGACDDPQVPSLLKTVEQWYALGGTGTQIMKLLSACEAGAELLYPDEKYDITFPLRRALYCMPTFCEAVENCVTGNQTIINLIINLGGGKGTKGEPETEPPVVTTNPVIGETCDYDALFGACTGIVDIVDMMIQDVFEKIEAATNNLELLNEFLEAIPGFGWLAAPLDVANVLQEQIAENYAAEYTLAVRDDLRCGLFCWLKDSCIVDWTTLYEYFGELAGQEILTIDMEDLGEYFTTGTFSGVEIVYAAYWMVLGALSFAGNVVDMNYEQFSKLAQAALNDPDPDWSIVCSCPSEACSAAMSGTGIYGTDFELLEYIGNTGYPILATATYNSVEDRVEGAYNGVVGGWYVWSALEEFTVPASWDTIERVMFSWDCDNETSSYDTAFIQFLDASHSQVGKTSYYTNTGDVTVEDIPAGTVYIRFMTRSRKNDSGGHAYQTEFTVCGTVTE